MEKANVRDAVLSQIGYFLWLLTQQSSLLSLVKVISGFV